MRYATRRATGASPYGVRDMSGNVSNWLNDWYASDYYSCSPDENPQGPPDTGDKVLRSGCFFDNWDPVRIAWRSHASPDYKYCTLGIRCAVTAESTMHVQQIYMLPYNHPILGPLALGLVRIWEESGMPVPGATVAAEWTIEPAGPFPQSRPTNTIGIAAHFAPRNWPATYQLCVTDVTALGLVYDPNQNLETCDALSPWRP